MPLIVFALCMLNVVAMIWLAENGLSYIWLALWAVATGAIVGFFEHWIVLRHDRRHS